MTKKITTLLVAAALLLNFSGTARAANDHNFIIRNHTASRQPCGQTSVTPSVKLGSSSSVIISAGSAAVGNAQPLLSQTKSGFLLAENSTLHPDDTDKTCYPGDRGTAVTALQQRLSELEYYDYRTFTGYYGPVTQQAVTRFQRVHGLTPDGIADSETLAALASSQASAGCSYPGDRGNSVKALQQRLQELGFYNSAVTGYFCADTQKALMEFQAQSGIITGAQFDSHTRARLCSPNASHWDHISRTAGADLSTSDMMPVDKMLTFAGTLAGCPYVYQAKGPAVFDSFGFVRHVLRYMGIRTSAQNTLELSTVDKWIRITDIAALLPGDLLFFQSDDKIVQTGLYIGNNQFIHASAAAGCVTISRLSGRNAARFCVARRIF